MLSVRVEETRGDITMNNDDDDDDLTTIDEEGPRERLPTRGVKWSITITIRDNIPNP